MHQIPESSTYRIAEERRTPACEHATQAFAAVDLAPSLDIALVQTRVNLAAALHQIQGRDSRVGGALQQKTASASITTHHP